MPITSLNKWEAGGITSGCWFIDHHKCKWEQHNVEDLHNSSIYCINIVMNNVMTSRISVKSGESWAERCLNFEAVQSKNSMLPFPSSPPFLFSVCSLELMNSFLSYACVLVVKRPTRATASTLQMPFIQICDSHTNLLGLWPHFGYHFNDECLNQSYWSVVKPDPILSNQWQNSTHFPLFTDFIWMGYCNLNPLNKNQ